MDIEDFWDNVKRMIDERNTSQEWVASHSGISFRTFQNWIYRKRLPDAVQSYRIAAALGVSVEYLITGKEPHTCRKYLDRFTAIKELVNKPL
jgi:transcriptional regulator with XRE-family HTH domain